MAPAAAKYDAKESVLIQEATSPTEAGRIPAWALPFIGISVMFACSAFIAVRSRRGRRPTMRQFELVRPVARQEEIILEDDDEELLIDE